MAYKLKVEYNRYRKIADRHYENTGSGKNTELTASNMDEVKRKAAKALNRGVTDTFPISAETVIVYNGKTRIGRYIKNASGNVVFIPDENANQKIAGRYWYVITGTDRSGKRFKRVLSSKAQAMQYNVWRGTLWKEDKSTGKREKIHEWYNF